MQNKNEEKPSNEENGQKLGECPYKKGLNNDNKEGLEGSKLEEVVKQAEDNHKNTEPPTENNAGLSYYLYHL